MPKPLGQIRQFKRLPSREEVLRHIEAAKGAVAFWEAALALIDRMGPPQPLIEIPKDETPLPFRETA